MTINGGKARAVDDGDDDIGRAYRMKVANKPYSPANGTEGECFFEAWCQRCSRDKPMSEGKNYDDCDESEICQIIADSFCGNVKEWVHNAEGFPTCTAFVPAGKPIPIQRCERTVDMFQPIVTEGGQR